MRTLEIFSGAGGLAKGLELAGFHHVALVERDSQACATLRHNFDPQRVQQLDIAQLDLNRLGPVDLIAGGPPCQPFSLAGKHRGPADGRDGFPQAIRCLAHCRPRAFLFENVKGLLRPSFAEYFDYLLARLAQPDSHPDPAEDWRHHRDRLAKESPSAPQHCYRVSYGLLNAADYGVPQRRERVMIVGIRADLERVWQFPAPSHSQERLHWEKYVSGIYWQRHRLPTRPTPSPGELFAPELAPWQTVRDALAQLPPPQSEHGIDDHQFRPGARVYPGHSGSPLDEPAKTLKAGNHGVPGGENMLQADDGSVRYFTSHEAKLLQTFPPDFVISGAWSVAMRQIGNAVPVRLAEVLGRQLHQLLAAN